jgi:hypothetical protein
MNDKPVELDTRRGMAAQKATGIRRMLADVEANAKVLRERQSLIEAQLLGVAASSWPEAAAKARYILNLYADTLGPGDSQHRALIAAVLADFTRLGEDT